MLVGRIAVGDGGGGSLLVCGLGTRCVLLLSCYEQLASTCDVHGLLLLLMMMMMMLLMMLLLLLVVLLSVCKSFAFLCHCIL
jgi:hypothetical protein